MYSLYLSLYLLFIIKFFIFQYLSFIRIERGGILGLLLIGNSLSVSSSTSHSLRNSEGRPGILNQCGIYPFPPGYFHLVILHPLMHFLLLLGLPHHFLTYFLCPLMSTVPFVVTVSSIFQSFSPCLLTGRPNSEQVIHSVLSQGLCVSNDTNEFFSFRVLLTPPDCAQPPTLTVRLSLVLVGQWDHN